MAERRLAGVTISDGTNDIGIILGYENNIEVEMEDVSGFNDTTGDPPIIRVNQKPVSVNETFSFNGISKVVSDSDNNLEAGLSAVRAAVKAGTELTLEFRFEDGHGRDYTGYGSNYSETGDRGEKTEKFSVDFQVNSERITTT